MHLIDIIIHDGNLNLVRNGFWSHRKNLNASFLHVPLCMSPAAKQSFLWPPFPSPVEISCACC